MPMEWMNEWMQTNIRKLKVWYLTAQTQTTAT
jgi:hypothetical protein